MVQKVCKRGVRSGNTLKASDSKFLRQYRLRSYISRQFFGDDSQITEPFSDGLGDTISKYENIVFSLNKKGRWELPKQLKSNIIDGDFSEEDYGVQLIEKLRLPKKANCVSFTSSFGNCRSTDVGKQTRVGRKRRKYFQVSSVLHANPAFTCNGRHKGRPMRMRPAKTKETDSDPADDYKPPGIRYEVVYPGPVTSSIIHNPKYIDSGYNERQWLNRHDKLRKKRTKLVDIIQEDLDSFDSDFDSSDEEEVNSYQETPDRETETSLEEILFHAKKIQTLVMSSGRQRKHSNNNKHNNSAIHDVNKCETESVNNTESEIKASGSKTEYTSTTLDPALVILSSEDTDEWVLKHKYADRILECDCFPRKFVLDISENISDLDNIKYVGKSKADTIFACLVFVHDIDNEINNMKESIYKVYLNMPFTDKITNVKIETLFDYTLTNIDEVIEKAVFFVAMLPEDAVKKQRCRLPRLSSSTNLEDCAKWESESYRLSTKHLFSRCFPSKGCDDAQILNFEEVSRMDAFFTEPSDISKPTDKFCSICFEPIGEGISATALMSCGHWFCDVCWKEHLITKIREGRRHLKCPEYDCSKEVDMGTLISLLDINHVELYLRQCHDTEVGQQSKAKWCPNPKCGAVLKIPSTNVKTVSCQCGRNVCFDCLGNTHWPAPCSAASAYQEKLIENGDDKLMPAQKIKTFVVRGKACPDCNAFVQKDGGCPYVACPCGQAFCWGCGKNWYSNTHGDQCYKYGYSNAHETIRQNIEPEDYVFAKINASKMDKWYKIALEHRVHQHQAKLRNLKAPMKELTYHINRYIICMERRNEPLITFDFDNPEKQYSSETEKTRDYLQNMADLYAELHRIAEHVPLYLESKQNSGEAARPVKQITKRMTALSASIYDLLQNGAGSNPKDVIDSLKETRIHARNCISGLLKRIDSTEIQEGSS